MLAEVCKGSETHTVTITAKVHICIMQEIIVFGTGGSTTIVGTDKVRGHEEACQHGKLGVAAKALKTVTFEATPPLFKFVPRHIVPRGGRGEQVLCVKKQPSQDVLHDDEVEEELGLARLVSSYTLPHQNSQPGGRGRQTARSKVLSRRARDT